MQIRPHSIQLRDSKRKLHFMVEMNLSQLTELGNCELIFLGNRFGLIRCTDGEVTVTQNNEISQVAKEYFQQQ